MKTIRERIECLGFTVIGDCKGYRDKVDVKCPDGHTWPAIPSNMLYGHKSGCPECAINNSSKSKRKKNTIIADNGDWLEIDISIPSHTASMKIDKPDWEYIKTLDCGRVYVDRRGYACVYLRGRKSRFIHRLLLDTSRRIDHINHDPSDNRRFNIRPCSASQNSMNRRVQTNSASGVTGVFWKRGIKKWRAQIKKNYKTTHLGDYDLFDDAVRARQKAEKEMFGDFRPPPT